MKDVAIYLRVSLEDDLIKDESNSISNQRRFLMGQVKGMPELCDARVREYKDDGHTGKNMDRPGMQEMLRDIREGRIGTVLCKDLSRFSRDYLVTGEYLEQIFPFLGIRFIAPGDNYDSKDFAGGIAEIDVGFKEILYDYYSEDLSMKVKTAQLAAKKNGKYLAVRPRYGYMLDPNDRHRVLVDDEAAPIAQRIFAMAADGMSTGGIARKLNEEGIESPCVYLNRRFGVKINPRWNRKWSGVSIHRILTDECYLGTYVFHKYVVEEVGSMKMKAVDPSEWMRLYDHHEALISKEMFEAVQEGLKSRRTADAVAKKKKRIKKHVMAGKVYCGVCGRRMIHDMCWTPKFRCDTKGIPENERHGIRISDERLEQVVMDGLGERALAVEAAEAAERENVEVIKARISEAKREISEKEALLERVRREKREAYEEYRLGDVGREDFMEQKALMDQNEEEVLAVIAKMEGQVLEIERELDEVSSASFASSGAEVGVMDEEPGSVKVLTRELVEAFVEKVVVMADGEVEVVWKV